MHKPSSEFAFKRMKSTLINNNTHCKQRIFNHCHILLRNGPKAWEAATGSGILIFEGIILSVHLSSRRIRANYASLYKNVSYDEC